MNNFKQFFEQKVSEEDRNIKDTLNKIPLSHRLLFEKYKFNMQDGNTLDKNPNHIGYIDDKNKIIAIAAPWDFGREFTFLHEIAHKVWNKILNVELRKKWKSICKKDSEECFCMAYANYYSNNPVVKYDKPQWNNFIKGLPK